MFPPVEHMSKLSLESMSMSSSPRDQGREEDLVETTYESDIDTSIDFDEAVGLATFPSGARYSVHGLDTGTRDAVVKALNTPSKLVLRGCSPRGQQGYVFLVSETIEYHVRVSYGTGPYDSPSCSCRQDERSVGLQHPCRHTLWVCDQILSQLVPLPEDPYDWRIDGYTTKHGNVCEFISDFHFDVLADSLRCDVIAGQYQKPRPHRIRTVREILATLCGKPVESYRPDLTSEAMGKRVVKEGDLEETIFRMLLDNDSLLSYFLSSMRNHELLNPRFRRFRDRADAALSAFDTYVKASDLERVVLSKTPQWCYRTLKDITEQLKSILMYSERELDDYDCRAATSTLVYILDQVVGRNEDHAVARDSNDGDKGGGSQPKSARKLNLCNDLIVESGRNFILDILDDLQLKFVRHVLPDLSRVERAIANTDIPQPYADKLGNIISRLRRASPVSEHDSVVGSRKRASQDDDRYPKRVK